MHRVPPHSTGCCSTNRTKRYRSSCVYNVWLPTRTATATPCSGTPSTSRGLPLTTTTVGLLAGCIAIILLIVVNPLKLVGDDNGTVKIPATLSTHSGDGYLNTIPIISSFVQGAMAAPPAGCSGPATITGSHTILLDPADTGGYTVVFSDCTVTGNLTINSTTSAVAHLNAVVDIQNSAIASTFTIAAGVLLGAGSRIRIRGLTGITAANLAGSAQDGAELLFSFVTLVATGTGGVLITGTYATQSRLLFDFCNLTTAFSALATITVSDAAFYNGSHFNITNSVIANTNGPAVYWTGNNNLVSSIPLGSFPTTIVALTNTSFSGRHAFSMATSITPFVLGSLLHFSGGCTFAVTGGAQNFMYVRLKGGAIYHEHTSRFVGTASIVVNLVWGDAGGNYFAVQNASLYTFGWVRPVIANYNDTIFIEDTTAAYISPYIGAAIGMNFTLRRVTVANHLQFLSTHAMIDSTFLIEDSQLNRLTQPAPTTRTTFTVLRTNSSSNIEFEHTATDSPLLIAAVRALLVSVKLARVRSPVRLEEVVTSSYIRVQNDHTDSGLTIVRSTANYALLGSDAWLRSPVLVDDLTVNSIVQIYGTFTDGRVQLNRTFGGYIFVPSSASLVRTAFLIHNSVISTSSNQQTLRLGNSWDDAVLEVLNTTVISTGQPFAVFVEKQPLNGSQHRFVDSVLVSTTATYPSSGTEPLQGVLVYAAGFGSGGLLEVRGTRFEARNESTYLVYAELNASRLHYDGSNVCTRSGRGRLHMKTLAAGTGDVVRVNNSDVDSVNIALASCTDCEVSVANTAINTTFTLDLAGQTRLAHRVLNTTVGGAVTMTCSGVLSGGSVLLHELQAASVAHAVAASINGGCYAVVRSRLTEGLALNATLVNLHATFEDTTVDNLTVVAGDLQDATLRFAANKLYSLSLVGVHRNASLAVDGNDLRASGTTALNIDAGASNNVTWRIQHNDMTGATFGVVLAPTTLVSNGAVAIVNNTMGPFHGVYQSGGGGGGIGSGATLWMRDNRIGSGSSHHSLALQLRGGRLDHDGSNAYGGGGHVQVYLTAADAGGNYFALQKAAVAEFLWSRSAGLATTNETIILLDTVIASNMTVQQRTCADCVVVVDQCSTSGNVLIDATRSTSSGIPSPILLQCSVCLVSSRFTSTVSIQGSFAGLVSTLQLLNSTFLNSVTVPASFTAASTASTDMVAADVANCTFQTAGGSLTFSGAFSAAAGAAIATIQVRDSSFKVTSSGSAVFVGTAAFGSNSCLYLKNVACTTPSTGSPCLEITSLDAATWFEVWNSTFFGGGIQVAVTSAATNMLLVGNRAPVFSITGAVAAVGGGRIAACNQDSSTAGWPAVTLGSTVGFTDLACTPAQTVTRCGPASSGQTTSVTEVRVQPPA